MLCEIDGMRTGNANPLLITVFLVVWIVVGLLHLYEAWQGM